VQKAFVTTPYAAIRLADSLGSFGPDYWSVGNALYFGNIVVGAAQYSSDYPHIAFLYNATYDTSLHRIVSFGGTMSEANGTDQYGNIVGWATTAGDLKTRAFFLDYTNPNNPTDLGGFGGDNTEANAVNGYGDYIVGFSKNSLGIAHAFRLYG